MDKKILFVCSGNLDRSPTAEELLQNKKGLEVKSAGTLKSAPVVISKELVEWADIIFAMEELHKKVITKISVEAENKVIVLHIPDTYKRGDGSLTRILKEKLANWLKK